MGSDGDQGGRAGWTDVAAPARRGRRWAITTYLILSTTGLTLVAVVMALIVGLVSAARSTDTLLRERSEHTRDALVAALDGEIRPQIVIAEGLAKLFAEGRLDPADFPALGRLFQGAIAAAPQLTRLALVTPACHAFILDAGRDTPVEADWRGRKARCDDVAWGRDANGARWLAPSWDAGLGQAVVILERPLRRGDQYIGYLYAAMSVAKLTDFLNSVPSGPGQTPFILYGRDLVVALGGMTDIAFKASAGHPLPRRDELGDPVLAHLWDKGNDPLALDATRVGERGVTLRLPSGMISVIYQVRDAGTDEPWIIGTYFLGSIGEAETRHLIVTAALGAVILLAALFASLMVGRWLGRPVRRLATAAEQIERENLDDYEPLRGSPVREFDEAAHAFNLMVAGLRDRQRIRDLFGRYVPVEVARGLLAGGGVTVGGENRPVSLFFSDIEDFTTLAESLPPEVVIMALNEYFEGVAAIVSAHGGIIVDYIGDAVFAMFGAPVPHDDHAARALTCVAELARFTAEFARGQRARGVEFGRTRFGVNTGSAMIGNFGSEGRLKYGAMGDLVNTAARLESANKAFGTTALVAAETIGRAGAAGVVTRPVGRVVLKGRLHPVEVHEILSTAPDWLPNYLAAYRALDEGAADAPSRVTAVARLAPDDPVTRLYARRVAEGDRSTLIILTDK